MELKYRLNEAKDGVILELIENEKPLGWISFPTEDFDNLIAGLARMRVEMTPPVAPTLDPGSRVEPLKNPAWRIPDPCPEDGRVLVLRHPGHGWLGFLIPWDQAAEMAEWLTRRPGSRPSK